MYRGYVWFISSEVTGVGAEVLLAGAEGLEEIEEGDTVILGEVEQQGPQNLQVLDQSLGLGPQLVPQGVQVVADGLGTPQTHNMSIYSVIMDKFNFTKYCQHTGTFSKALPRVFCRERSSASSVGL